MSILICCDGVKCSKHCLFTKTNTGQPKIHNQIFINLSAAILGTSYNINYILLYSWVLKTDIFLKISEELVSQKTFFEKLLSVMNSFEMELQQSLDFLNYCFIGIVVFSLFNFHKIDAKFGNNDVKALSNIITCLSETIMCNLELRFRKADTRRH